MKQENLECWSYPQVSVKFTYYSVIREKSSVSSVPLALAQEKTVYKVICQVPFIFCNW